MPVYNPKDEAKFDTLASLKAFAQTNYTISAEIQLRSMKFLLQNFMDYMHRDAAGQNMSFTGTRTL
jgi:hypothetical protein